MAFDETSRQYVTSDELKSSASKTIYASFADAAQAEKAAGALLDYGVRAEDISLVARVSGPDATTDPDEADDTKLAAKSGISTTTPGDAAAGAAKGAGIGLGAGIAAALASIFIPGFGLVAGGGALALALGGAAGATAAGAVAGGVTGYLKDQGVPDEAVSRYAADYEAGGAILEVTVPSKDVDEASAQEVIAKYGGGYTHSVGDNRLHPLAA